MITIALSAIATIILLAIALPISNIIGESLAQWLQEHFSEVEE